MRVPPFERYTRWMAGFGLFLCGMIVGSAVFMAIFQQTSTILSVRNKELSKQVEELKTNLDTVNKNRTKQAYIGAITVHLVREDAAGGDSLDEQTAIELEKRVSRDLKPISGKPVAELRKDPLLYMRLIEDKLYPGVFDRDYQVHVKSLAIVQSDLTVWVTASAWKRN
ncbi:hypothetical protein J31TS4_15350 [Paenibacillus sp. J31TS4]|uniref:hypothetical protein n=1 Tax=Paenibacillus sp. J31TS4 TaxID=2807195 RepID=UPI001B1568DB|nr:hypothetical protein [Paenibacillus sp. J31TS4]GIP38255.1 hypothetical protein J31TS4_15350 [Paenibacillus sp. J31TS4]